MSARYRLPDAAAIRAVPLDDLVAVYHRASGVTHLVDAATPEILAALSPHWCTAPELLAQLSAAFEMTDADPAALDARLDELAAAGLIERG